MALSYSVAELENRLVEIYSTTPGWTVSTDGREWRFSPPKDRPPGPQAMCGIVRRVPASGLLAPRNASCPCGSGRKYKRCCRAKGGERA